MNSPAMNPLFGVILLALAVLPFASAGDAQIVTYYVQLVRGNNDDKPPLAEAKRIGPKLSKKLQPVFKWESYWELNRRRIELPHGQKTKLKLSPEREVVIDHSEAGKRSVTAYSNGKIVSRTTRPIGEAMTIIGGERDANSVWFIVVRRDTPTDGE